LFAARPCSIAEGSFVNVAAVAGPIAPVVERGPKSFQHPVHLVVGVRGEVLHLVGVRFEVVELLGRAAAGEEVRGRFVEFVGRIEFEEVAHCRALGPGREPTATAGSRGSSS
jgi:hypothetical protein